MWDKTQRFISEMVETEREGRYDMSRARMESIRDFFLYVSKIYRDMNPYLKGDHLTLESWRQYMNNEGWRLRGEELKIAKVEGEW